MRELDALGDVSRRRPLEHSQRRRTRHRPRLAQSLALGGDDADLIYERALVDLKSSSQLGSSAATRSGN